MPRPLRPLARAARPVLGALAALAGACSDGPSAPPASPTAPLDVAPLLAEMTMPGVPGMGVSGPLAVPFAGQGGSATGAVTVPTSCPYDTASRSFVCPAVTRDGLTVAIAYTLLDVAGKPLATADRNATASIRTVSTVKGTVAVPAGSELSGSLTVDQRQELTLSGLLAGPHRLDGSGTSKVDGRITIGGVTMPMSGTTTETVSGLVLPARVTGASPWPTAGTVTIDATTTAFGGVASAVRIQVAFDGTSTATITLTMGGLTQRCTVNLAGGAAPVCAG